MRRGIAVVAFASVLAGCASYSWYNPNVPSEIAQRDNDECRQQATYLVNTPLMSYDPFWPGFPRYWGPGPLEMEQDVYRRCMIFKGYRQVKNPDPNHPAGAQ
jgi:hypothetical protein